jgi:hypothetical protein
MGHGHELDVERPERETPAERHHVDRNVGAPGSLSRLAWISAAVNGVA